MARKEHPRAKVFGRKFRERVLQQLQALAPIARKPKPPPRSLVLRGFLANNLRRGDQRNPRIRVVELFSAQERFVGYVLGTFFCVKSAALSCGANRLW